MKHLQSFKIFESGESLTPEQKAFLDRCVEGSWTLNPEGKIDVDGDFLGHLKQLTDFKGLKFGRVTGNFRCDTNRLTSLEGAPSTVGGDFLCYKNDLTSLAGSPSSVGGDFWCDNNRLPSLAGAPSTVRGDFLCFSNSLTSLDGAPSAVGGNFWCYNNRLTSLEGGPVEVGGRYDCTPNDNLVSLKGAPEILKGSFEGPGGISILSGGWSPEGIFETWKKTEDPRRKALLTTLLTKERLQKAIDADPAGAMGMLRDYLSEDWLKGMGLVWPESTRDYVQALTDLGEIGF